MQNQILLPKAKFRNLWRFKAGGEGEYDDRSARRLEELNGDFCVLK